MADATHTSPISGLTPEEGGFVFGLALLGQSAETAGVLASPAAGRCAAAAGALQGQNRQERAKVMADALRPMAGIETIHPSWIAVALAHEPRDLAAALVLALPASLLAGV